MEKWFLTSPGEASPLDLTNDLVRAIETQEGMRISPAFTGDNSARQGHGLAWAQKPFGPSEIHLAMWLHTYGDEGLDRRAWEQLHDQLSRYSSWPYGQLTLTRYYVAGQNAGRWCFCERSQPITPVMLGDYGARIALDLLIPSGFWFDNELSDDSFAATNGPHQLTSWAGGTAPSTGVRLILDGTPAGITVSTAAGWIRVARAIPSGSPVTFDADTGAITAGWSDAIAYSGPTYFEVPPGSSAPIVTVSGGGSGTVRVVGQRAYLNA